MFGKNRKRTELITGIDIGSTAVRVAVGQLGIDMQGKSQLHFVGLCEVPAEGVHKGAITSIEEVVSSISHALEQTERLVGMPIEHAWIGLTGTNTIIQESKGVVAVAKTDGEIASEDVDRAVDAARMVATPLNYDIIHVIPRRFCVDGQTGIKDPIGMTGIRLEVDTQMIYGLTAHMKTITKAVYRTGIDIDDLVLSIFATGEVVATSRQKELGVAVVNIGGSTTSLVVYEEGEIIHTAIFPIGGEHVTNDLAIGLRISIDVAEQVKITYGQCTKKGLIKKERVNLLDLGGSESEEVYREYIVDIVSARVAEILEKVDKELTKVDRSGRLPSGVIFTGGGAKISGLVDLAKEVLCLPAGLGYPVDLQSTTEKISDIGFATAVGLVQWGANLHESGGHKRLLSLRQGGNILTQVKKIFKSLIP